MSRRPFMMMYWGDYLGDTRHLTTIQHGAYLLLIAHYWMHRGLPDDDRTLATIIGMRGDTWRRWHRETIRHFFEDGWRHKRIDEELAKADAITKKRRDAVASRRDRDPYKCTSFVTVRARATPQPHPQPEKKKSISRALARTDRHAAGGLFNGGEAAARQAPDAVAKAFEGFWSVYPRRVAKDAARKAFAAALKRDGVTPELLIAGAHRYVSERAGQDPKFTKHPAMWLNAGCWQDEPMPRATHVQTASISDNSHDAVRVANERFERMLAERRKRSH